MGSLKRPLDKLRIVLSGVVGRAPGPRAALIGALLMWLGVVIVAGAHAPARQDNTTARNKTSATAVTSTAPAAAGQTTASAGGYVGEAKCLECHEDQRKYHDTPHGRVK